MPAVTDGHGPRAETSRDGGVRGADRVVAAAVAVEVGGGMAVARPGRYERRAQYGGTGGGPGPPRRTGGGGDTGQQDHCGGGTHAHGGLHTRKAAPAVERPASRTVSIG